MEERDDKLRIEVVFDSPLYGKVACLIVITDYCAVARFSDKRLAKQMFLEENKTNKNISYDERRGFLIEKYPTLMKEQIAKELITKFEKHNVYVKTKPVED